MKAPAPIGYYKEIVEAITDALMVVGPNGTILMANAAIERFLRLSQGKIPGRLE